MVKITEIGDKLCRPLTYFPELVDCGYRQTRNTDRIHHVSENEVVPRLIM